MLHMKFLSSEWLIICISKYNLVGNTFSQTVQDIGLHWWFFKFLCEINSLWHTVQECNFWRSWTLNIWYLRVSSDEDFLSHTVQGCGVWGLSDFICSCLAFLIKTLSEWRGVLVIKLVYGRYFLHTVAPLFFCFFEFKRLGMSLGAGLGEDSFVAGHSWTLNMWFFRVFGDKNFFSHKVQGCWGSFWVSKLVLCRFVLRIGQSPSLFFAFSESLRAAFALRLGILTRSDCRLESGGAAFALRVGRESDLRGDSGFLAASMISSSKMCVNTTSYID